MANRKLRIILMGTGPFAVPAFRKILEGPDEVSLFVTRPTPPPVGRVKSPPNPVLDLATEFGFETFQPASVNSPESIEKLAQAQADLMVVCDYGQILSRETLSIAPLGGINLHGSLLPRHRGAAPIQWAVLRGDQESGVTVIHMTPRLDGGPMLERRSLPIGMMETAGELEPRLSQLGVEATIAAIEQLRAWDQVSPIGEIQDQSSRTLAPRLAKSDGQLDFRLPADYLFRHIKAFQPWPGSFADLQLEPGKVVRILIRQAIPRMLKPQDTLESQPGVLLDLNLEANLDVNLGPPLILAPDRTSSATDASKCGSRSMLVACAPGSALELLKIQPAGKREMTVDEFLRGQRIGPQTRWLLPDQPVSALA